MDEHLDSFYYKLAGIVMLAGILCIVIIAALLNTYTLKISLNGLKHVNTAIGEPYQDPGAVAVDEATILPFLSQNVEVKTDGRVDTSTTGDYTITYTAQNGDRTISAKRIVTVKDLNFPQIQLTYSDDSYTPYDHPYTEEGFQCTDEKDGDLSTAVQSIEKNGYVYYSVIDSSNNVTRAVRKIIYDDREGPVITLAGGNEINVINGSDWTDEYTAIDDCDGDVTANVQVDGTVDTNTSGDYVLTYTVSDSHGNTSTVTRTVHVIDQPINNNTGIEGPKVIYLTFDDGPGAYTDQLLDILAKYNVKASFFTTSAYPGYAYCIGKEAAAGHTVCVHSATHNYALVYSSDEAYWADFNAQNDVIEAQTGSRSTFFRFPGGSSNTVSANYSAGIVTRLANEAAANGYTYFDWNVSSGDAGATTDTNQVYQNVITQVERNSANGYPSVVLQHDVKDYSVAAVESIILWGLENGYSFQPLTSSSYTAHHNIAN